MLSRLCGILAALVLMCPCRGEDIRAITKAERVFAIYTEHGSLGPGSPQLIFAAWGDGFIVWSHDRKNGGDPFSAAKVDPGTIDKSLRNFEEIGLFQSAPLRRLHFGPDADFTTIFIRDGENELKMQSWHELHESGGGLAATSHGIEVLGDRILLNVIADEPAQYLYYRLVWSNIRLAAVDLIPASGASVTGSFKKRHGIASWETTEMAEP